MKWHSFRNGGEACDASIRSKSQNKSQNKREVYLGGLIWGTSVIDSKGNIYVGSTNKTFFCIDSKGTIQWKFKIKKRADSLIDSAACLSPDERVVVVPGGDGYLYALSTANGKEKWSFHASGASDEVHKSGVVVNSFEGNVIFSKDGRCIYAGNDNNNFYCIDAHNGKELWSFKTNMMIWTVGAFSKTIGNIVFGSLDGWVYVVDTNDGSLVHKFNTEGEIKSSPVLDSDDKIFVCNSGGWVHCLRLVTGSDSLHVVWRTEVGAEVYSTPSIKDGFVVVCTMEGIVMGLDKETGFVKWQTDIAEYTTSSPLITQDNIVVCTNSKGRLIFLNLENGELLGCLSVSRDNTCINASPVFHEPSQCIVVGAYDGYLYFVPPSLVFAQKDRKELTDIQSGRAMQLVSRPGSLMHIIRLRTEHSNAYINPNTLKVEGIDLTAFEIALSPDGRFVNLLPISKSGFHKAPINVHITGSYYLSTTWLRDRFNLQDMAQFEEDITLPAMELADNEAQLDLSDVEILSMDVHKLRISQPFILDTYIPAAVDGLGFIMHALDFRNDHTQFSVVMIPAIPDEDEPFEILKEPTKVVKLHGQRWGNVVMLKSLMNGFTFSAMGGTIPFSDVRIFGLLDPDRKLLTHISMYLKSNCMRIKGNGESYEFSTEVLNQLCDRTLNLHCVGTAETRAFRVMDEMKGDFDDNQHLIVYYDKEHKEVESKLLKEIPQPEKDSCKSVVFVDGQRQGRGGGDCWRPRIIKYMSDRYWVDHAFGPLVDLSCKIGLHPNWVTISSMFTIVAMMVLHFRKSTGYLVWVPMLMMYKWFADAIDGPIARGCKRTSKLGGTLDLLADTFFSFAVWYMFMNMIWTSKSNMIHILIAIILAFAPWLLILMTSGWNGIHSHQDFKNKDNVWNFGLWMFTENTFVVILAISIAYVLVSYR